MALTDKMAASKQSRRPAQATPLPPAIALARSLPAGAVLYIRLWGGEETHILPSPASESPGLPLCLTMDMIAACGGSISETHGQVLVARFSSFQDGVLAARRLQWAAQGLLETPTFHSTGVAVLVHSPEDALDPKAKDASFYALSQGSAGQILFTHGAAGYAESLPGYVFGAGADGALRELQWGGSGGQQTRSKDDDTIAGLIEKKGPEAKAKAYPVQADVSSFNVSGNVHPTPSASGQAEKETGQSSTRQSGQRRVKLLWIGGVASAAILLLVAFLVLRSFVQSTHSASVPVASAPAASVPAASLPAAQPAGGAVITAPPGGSTDAIQSQASASPVQPNSAMAPEPEHEPAAHQENSADEPDKPKEKKDHSLAKGEQGKSKAAKEQTGNQTRRGCDLEQSEINAQLVEAESRQARGKYKDAQRQFESVLACEPGNARALAGLRTVRQAELLNQ